MWGAASEVRGGKRRAPPPAAPACDGRQARRGGKLAWGERVGNDEGESEVAIRRVLRGLKMA